MRNAMAAILALLMVLSLAACGGGETEAMDCGVAAVLLPAVCALYGAAGKKKLAIAIAEAFGEENIAACKKVLN